MSHLCTLVLPCRDEAPALRRLLPAVPPELAVVVVDNGSTDDTAEVARRLGATVVHEPRPGYGAAVHAGVEAATGEFLAVMDGDGSFDPADLLPLLAQVRGGEADLATGRRRASARGVWPWHARAGSAVVLWWLRRRTGLPVHDIAPMRVCRRADLLALDVRDRRFGYPVELLQKAQQAGWRLTERDVAYLPAGRGHPVQGVGVGARVAAGRAGLRPGALVRTAVLVMAKAPVAGEVKTRLGEVVGHDLAARLAAAALLDTLEVCERVWPVRAERHVALAGDLAAAVAGPEIETALAGWTVHAQRGADFARRLVAAHADVAAASGLPVVQIGMDTPHVTPAALADVAARVGSVDAVLGPAADGGWWVLAVTHGRLAAPLAGVAMSTPTTYDDTRSALEAAGTRVTGAAVLRDVDTVADAMVAALAAPGSRFARAWAAAGVETGAVR